MNPLALGDRFRVTPENEPPDSPRGYNVVVSELGDTHAVLSLAEHPSISERGVPLECFTTDPFVIAGERHTRLPLPTLPHEHIWEPMLMDPGHFLCACGQHGWRWTYGPKKGQIHPTASKRSPYNPHHVAVSAGEGGHHARHGKRGPGSY